VSDSPTPAEQYGRALALPPGDIDQPRNAAHLSALTRAHDLRKFEIENYWKRATYFWAFQLAAFTLLGFLWARVVVKDEPLSPNVLLIPGGLGAITALVGLLTAKGSKFWQENWESHVDALEPAIEGRLTQVVFVKDGQQYSVSRVNERLLSLLTIGWMFLFFATAFRLDLRVPGSCQPWLASTALVLSVAYVLSARTNLRGMHLSFGETEWRPLPKQKEPRWSLVLRNTAMGVAKAPPDKANLDGRS
jgi:hypothetical protein